VTDDGGEEERREDSVPTELLDKYFDFFKHLTTLNVATAVVVLAISQARPAGLALVVTPLAAFGFSLLASLNGMMDVLRYLSRQGESSLTMVVVIPWRRRGKASRYLSESLAGSLLFFVLGLIGFAYGVLD
jgi:hypothetical protein